MKIALLGYGKMGKEIEAIALQRGHSIVLKVSSENAKTFSNEEVRKADVAIDFSMPDSAEANCMRCFAVNLPIVMGTTGWHQRLNDVKQIALHQNQSFLYASNFSVGVNLFFQLNKKMAELMQPYTDYSLSMQEIHHLQKLDSPSGTAIHLANDLLKSFPEKQKWVNHSSNEKTEIGIESLRVEGVPGTHSINYSSSIDSIQIKHTAHNRKGFAIGALLAAEWLLGKKGVFEMKDVLGLK